MWTEKSMTCIDSLLVSLIGLTVVMMELALLAFVIVLFAKVLSSLTKTKPPEVSSDSIDTVCNDDTEEETFAVLMAVVCEDLQVPPDQLRFKEIKGI